MVDKCSWDITIAYRHSSDHRQLKTVKLFAVPKCSAIVALSDIDEMHLLLKLTRIGHIRFCVMIMTA